jgi:isohexenylglutaconyl-CoA hydratase
MSQLPLTQTVDLELSNDWLTVWFNQPERRNPLTDAVVQDLISVCDCLMNDHSVRGLTLRGRGGYFCAGGDLKGFQTLTRGDGDTSAAVSTSVLVGELLEKFNRLPQVTLALLEGAAMAGGLGLACCCDVILATHETKFAFSETRIGLSPAQIARYVLQKCGYATGRRLMVTAARFDGTEAYRMGLVDHVENSAEALFAMERQIQADVLGCSPNAIAATKALIAELPSVADEQKIEFAAKNFTTCLQSPDGREGVSAFLEKRKPRWHQEI